MANDKRFLWMFLATLVFVLGGLQNTMGKERVHSIAKKDSLESVAARYGCHVDLLIEWNEKKAAAGFVDLSTIISNFDELPKGKKLWLPPASACEKGSEGPKTSELPALERGRAYNCVWDAENIETGRLAQLMNQRGFLPPSSFRALVVKHQLERDDKGRPKRVLHHLYDYAGLASDWRGWNPASTIKVYSGLAAVERVKRLGFDPEKVQITYHDAAGDRSYPMSELLEKAMHISKNVPHNRLVQLAGFDYINARPRDLVGGGASSGGFLSLRGMHDSFIMVGYALSEWRALGQSASLRYSPPITLEQEGRTLQLAEQRSNQNYSCKKAACTTLSDLSKQICYDVLRRGLTMPSLDSDHSYYEDQGTGIPDTELAILAPIHFEAACLKAKQAGENCNPITTRAKWLGYIKGALGGEGELWAMFDKTFVQSKEGGLSSYYAWMVKHLDRTRVGRKDPVWDIFHKDAGRIYRKSGYSNEWASDNLLLYFFDGAGKEKPRMEWASSPPKKSADDIRYSVTMACHPGRYCLKEAAGVLRDILLSNEL